MIAAIDANGIMAILKSNKKSGFNNFMIVKINDIGIRAINILNRVLSLR